MNFEDLKTEYAGGKLHRVHITFTTGEHGATTNEAENWVAERLKIEPTEGGPRPRGGWRRRPGSIQGNSFAAGIGSN